MFYSGSSFKLYLKYNLEEGSDIIDTTNPLRGICDWDEDILNPYLYNEVENRGNWSP